MEHLGYCWSQHVGCGRKTSWNNIQDFRVILEDACYGHPKYGQGWWSNDKQHIKYLKTWLSSSGIQKVHTETWTCPLSPKFFQVLGWQIQELYDYSMPNSCIARNSDPRLVCGWWLNHVYAIWKKMHVKLDHLRRQGWKLNIFKTITQTIFKLSNSSTNDWKESCLGHLLSF